jgi:hypothetical protein
MGIFKKVIKRDKEYFQGWLQGFFIGVSITISIFAFLK